MKKSASALFVALFALLLSACSDRPVDPEAGEFVVDTLLENGTLECRVSCRFATILNAGDSPALEAIERANVGYFFGLRLERTPACAAAAADTLLREIRSEYLSEPFEERSFEYTLDSRLTVADTLLTFVIDRYEYMGGVHGMYGTRCHTYSLATGREYGASDLFDARQLMRLDELIRENIYEQYDARSDEELEREGFFPDYIAVTDNFLLSDAGITFFYNPYELGCYALGGVEVTIGPEALATL